MSARGGGGGGGDDNIKTGLRPFPVAEMVVIALALVSQAYAVCSLFPYVGFLVRDLLGLSSKNESGYYAGFLSSTFMIGRVFSAYAWGHLADRLGRRPVMLFGLFFIFALSLAFGFSTTLSWAIVCRFLLGFLNGIEAVARAMISEICGAEHVVLGMGFVAGSWSIAFVLGPALGGLLAQPAVHFPSTFSEGGIFGRYPYLLPNAVGACLALLTMCLVVLVLPASPIINDESDYINPTAAESSEMIDVSTPSDDVNHADCVERSELRQPSIEIVGIGENVSSRKKVDSVASSPRVTTNELYCSRGSDDTLEVHDFNKDGMDDAVIVSDKGQPVGLLSLQRIRKLLMLFAIFSAVIIGYDETYPLWTISTAGAGGLEWNTRQIGQVLGATGIGMTLFQFIAYPFLVKWIGICWLQRSGCFIAIALFPLLPSLNQLRNDALSLFCASAGIMTVLRAALSVNNIAMNIATNNAVLATDRGKLNGLVVTVESVGKAIGPSMFAVVFAWSISEVDPLSSGENATSSSSGGDSEAAREDDLFAAPFGRNYRFVFCMFAVAMLALGAIAWRSLTRETLTFPLWQQEWNTEQSGTGGSSAIPYGGRNDLSSAQDFEMLETSQHSVRNSAEDTPVLV